MATKKKRVVAVAPPVFNAKKRLTREEIESIPAPEFTDTWHPISHKEVIRSLDHAVGEMGIGVREESYSIALSGANLFGTWTLDLPMGDSSLVQLGFRNSTNKTFAVGICAGTHVMVCSNMVFSGKFMEFRKHTSGMEYEVLIEKATMAMKSIVEEAGALHEWQEDLRKVEMSDDNFKILTYDAIATEIVSVKHWNKFQESYQEECEAAKGEKSLYQFHGAVTRMIRGKNLFGISHRTVALKELCDTFTQRLS